MKISDTFVTVILIADDFTNDISKKVKATSRLLLSHYTNYEIFIIDNQMASQQLAAAKALLPNIACIRIIRLSKKNDTDTAIFAGIEASIGDYVCILYGGDPVKLIPQFVKKAQRYDIVFGLARNMRRHSHTEEVGAKLFYWYSKKYLDISMPMRGTYFMCMNRSVANALTRSGRFMRHIRHMAQQVGFSSTIHEYELPEDATLYSQVRSSTLFSRSIDLISNYSSHPLRFLSYIGIMAGALNIVYAIYVVFINFSSNNVAHGWTSLSLQSSLMFFILFLIIAALAEYIGKILNETQQEPPYHIMNELSSTISVADETRRNVTK
jgi:glycosyltransferase involved in cell wall biosynthesis